VVATTVERMRKVQEEAKMALRKEMKQTDRKQREVK